MAGSDELNTFREEWKKELKHQAHSEHPDENHQEPENKVDHYQDRYWPFLGEIGKSHHKDECNDDTSQDATATNDSSAKPNASTSSTDSVEYYPFQILTQFLNEAPKRQNAKTKEAKISYTKRKYFDIETRGINQKKQRDSINITPSQVQEKNQPRTKMLDIFIADLDEINEIPFFDTTLPREVAIKIFQHLDMNSLCHCSQVSQSWKSLADDELLWFKICQSLGYDSDLHANEGQGWKNIVRKHIEEKRLLKANWKARIGKPYNLNFARGGVLCAVHSFGSNIVAGYTSCNVRLWDTKTGDVCTFNASNTALVLDESAEELGRIHNVIKHVLTTAHITTASFIHGFVDIWRNEEGTDPVHTCMFRNPDITSLSAHDVDSKFSLVAASQGSRIQIAGIGEEVGKCMSDFDMNSSVSQLDWINHCQSNGSQHLLITCDNSVDLKTLDICSPWAKQDSNLIEIHNVIWAPITSVGFRGITEEVAVGFNLYAGPGTQIKVNIYDLNKNQLKMSLTGHTWLVSCIFMPSSLPDQLATGSGDRKIRLYDLRVSSSATTTLLGHIAKVTSVEMDDWKVVSGDEAGFVHVWDQRMCRKLWDVRNRHPVQYCHFDERLLIIGNVPYLKFPEVDEFETVSSLRYRGTVQVYDFLANQQTQGIPDICLSSYNEPEAYDYNISLAVPYDVVS